MQENFTVQKQNENLKKGGGGGEGGGVEGGSIKLLLFCGFRFAAEFHVTIT